MLSFNFSSWGSIFQGRIFFCFHTSSLIPALLFPTRERLKLSRLSVYEFISISSEQEGCWTFLPIQLCCRDLRLHTSQGIASATSEVSACARSQNDPFLWNRKGFSAGRLLCTSDWLRSAALYMSVGSTSSCRPCRMWQFNSYSCSYYVVINPVWIMQFRYSQPLHLFSLKYFLHLFLKCWGLWIRKLVSGDHWNRTSHNFRSNKNTFLFVLFVCVCLFF